MIWIPCLPQPGRHLVNHVQNKNEQNSKGHDAEQSHILHQREITISVLPGLSLDGAEDGTALLSPTLHYFSPETAAEPWALLDNIDRTLPRRVAGTQQSILRLALVDHILREGGGQGIKLRRLYYRSS